MSYKKNRRHLQNREILSIFALYFGKMQEWLNWPAWKASKPQKGFRGSNPLLSAKRRSRGMANDGSSEPSFSLFSGGSPK